MEVRLPHEVIYDTPHPVPVVDIIESLQGTLQLTQEIGPILQGLVPGLVVETLTITVTEISQASPLREAFAFGLVAVYQEKIGAEVPKIIHDLFGVDLPHGYDNLLSLVLIVLIFYSGQLLYNKGASLIIGRPKIKKQLDGLIAEVAAMLHLEEDAVRRVLDERYLKGKGGNIQAASLKVLRPSKNQANAAVRFDQRQIEHDVIAEFPGDAQVHEAEPGPSSAPLENVDIYLHAQDLDHNKQGWAAVVPALSPRRIRMNLYPPIDPADIYTKQHVKGDLLVESRRNAEGVSEPVRVHLIRIHDAPKGPTALPRPTPKRPKQPRKTTPRKSRAPISP